MDDFFIYENNNLDQFLSRIKIVFKKDDFYLVKMVRIILEIKQLSDEDLKLLYNEEDENKENVE